MIGDRAIDLWYACCDANPTIPRASVPPMPRGREPSSCTTYDAMTRKCHAVDTAVPQQEAFPNDCISFLGAFIAHHHRQPGPCARIVYRTPNTRFLATAPSGAGPLRRPSGAPGSRSSQQPLLVHGPGGDSIPSSTPRRTVRLDRRSVEAGGASCCVVAYIT